MNRCSCQTIQSRRGPVSPSVTRWSRSPRCSAPRGTRTRRRAAAPSRQGARLRLASHGSPSAHHVPNGVCDFRPADAAEVDHIVHSAARPTASELDVGIERVAGTPVGVLRQLVLGDRIHRGAPRRHTTSRTRPQLRVPHATACSARGSTAPQAGCGSQFLPAGTRGLRSRGGGSARARARDRASPCPRPPRAPCRRADEEERLLSVVTRDVHLRVAAIDEHWHLVVRPALLRHVEHLHELLASELHRSGGRRRLVSPCEHRRAGVVHGALMHRPLRPSPLVHGERRVDVAACAARAE